MLLSFSRQASLRHSKKISKLSIDSITDLPLEKKQFGIIMTTVNLVLICHFKPGLPTVPHFGVYEIKIE